MDNEYHIVDYDAKLGLSADVFASMKKLRLLDIDGNFTSTQPTFLRDELRWLCWNNYPFLFLPMADMCKLAETLGLGQTLGGQQRFRTQQSFRSSAAKSRTRLRRLSVSSEVLVSGPNFSHCVLGSYSRFFFFGYHSVPYPFNDNYTPPLETNEVEISAQYGQTPTPASVETEQSGHTENIEVNDTNVSTLCADQVKVHDGHDQNTNNSCSADNDSKARDEVNNSNASTSCTNKELVHDGKSCDADTLTMKKPKPQKSVKEFVKCSYACAGESPLKQNSFGQGPSDNLIYMKRRTCFNCGTPGHIVRNCPDRVYVPYYGQG
uniref:CCHC-type domain-containing protein n=1 Tax=Lactuca sativa TaxID=4236 RepID=A0A9R1XQ86_LACSA|nr:hypothetical protein LSAT_V11C200055610 [Lactuca sativa]